MLQELEDDVVTSTTKSTVTTSDESLSDGASITSNNNLGWFEGGEFFSFDDIFPWSGLTGESIQLTSDYFMNGLRDSRAILNMALFKEARKQELPVQHAEKEKQMKQFSLA